MESQVAALLHPRLPGHQPVHTGKVRDMYDLGDELLMVTSDRLSAFDVIFPDPIPGKGRVLTAISAFWFRKLSHILPHHLIEVPSREWLSAYTDTPEELEGRSMRVRKCRPLKVECVVRGSLEGSGWKEYQATGRIQEHSLPSELNLHDQLPQPIFTPSTKAHEGHDESITFNDMAQIVGSELSERMREVSLALFCEAREYLAARGICLADTKFEFGMISDDLILIDEVLTPDSSRFLMSTSDGEVLQMDKQFVRDWVETTDWQKQPPAPHIPAEVIAQTRDRYREISRLITGKEVL